MPALKPCPACACHVTERATTCPHCGATVSAGSRSRTAAVLLGLVLAGCTDRVDTAEPPPTVPASIEAEDRAAEDDAPAEAVQEPPIPEVPAAPEPEPEPAPVAPEPPPPPAPAPPAPAPVRPAPMPVPVPVPPELPDDGGMHALYGVPATR